MADKGGQDAGQAQELDELLGPLGGFGKFQLFNMVCICSIVILCSFSELGYVLTAGQVTHRCLIAECESADSSFSGKDKPWLPYAINWDNTTQEFDSCRRYNGTSVSSRCDADAFDNQQQYRCDRFMYETKEWTIAREDWGIHCNEDRYKLGLVGSLNNAGQVVGGLYVGLLQDRYGRKLVIVTLALIVIAIGTIKSFSVNFAMMLAMEFLEATAAVALFNGPFVLALEIVDPTKRVLAGTAAAVAYPVGEMIIGLVQYLTFDWRNTIRICYLPFLLVASFYWILPESVRWLLDNGRPDDAIVVLRKLAKMNGTHLPEDTVKQILKNEAEKALQAKAEEVSLKTRLVSIWKSRIMRFRAIWTLIVWICTIFVYFAITVNSVSISNDKFVNFILNGVIEIPSYFFVFFILDRIGRKKTQTSLMILCGVACIADAFMPNDENLSWARLVLYLIGKFGASGALFVVDIYTTELYPTFIRGTVMSIGLLFGKIASILATEVNLLEEVYKPLPLLIFGAMSLIGVAGTLTFPETQDCHLPNTIEQAEQLGKHKDAERTDGHPN